MQAYNGSLVLRNAGIDPLTNKKDLNAGINKNVTVRLFSVPPGQGALADIYDIDDNQIANPLQSDINGNYFFKVDAGVYDVISEEGGANQQIQPQVILGGSSSGSGTTISENPPNNPDVGDKWKRCTDLKEFTYYVDQDSGQWVEDRPSYSLVTGEVNSVNGKTGQVVLNKSDVGLSNADNTTDLNKPISTATQAALDDLTTDDISDSAAVNKYTSAAGITKLAGIEDNATANSTDATLLDRANQTGTQTAATISDFEVAVKDAINAQEIVYLEDADALNYTLSASDTGKFICFNTPNLSTITIPDGLPLGTSIVISNLGQNNSSQGGVTISINETVRGALTIADVAGMMSITKVVAGATNADNIWQSSERV